jgi:exodeoxyribonuclease VIII
MLMPGLNDYVENNLYHGDRTHYSSSVLKMALRDIRTFHRKYVLHEVVEKKSDAMNLGSYVHALILEPHKVADEFVEYTGVRRGQAWEEFQATNQGKTILGNLLKTQGDAMAEAIRHNEVAFNLFNDGAAEVTATAVLNDAPIKVRADYRREDGKIPDIKTTSGSLTVESVQSTIVKYDYDLSAALYVDVFSKVMNMPHEFYFVFVSKDNPDCAVFKASPDMIANGRRKYTKAIKIINEGLKTGKWYETGIQEIDMPHYGYFA